MIDNVKHHIVREDTNATMYGIPSSIIESYIYYEYLRLMKKYLNRSDSPYLQKPYILVLCLISSTDRTNMR